LVTYCERLYLYKKGWSEDFLSLFLTKNKKKLFLKKKYVAQKDCASVRLSLQSQNKKSSLKIKKRSSVSYFKTNYTRDINYLSNYRFFIYFINPPLLVVMYYWRMPKIINQAWLI